MISIIRNQYCFCGFLGIEVKGIQSSFGYVEFMAYGSYTGLGAWKFKQDRNSENLDLIAAVRTLV